MKLFAPHDEVAALRAKVDSGCDDALPAVTLVWYLRQGAQAEVSQYSVRARELIRTLPATAQAPLTARLRLVKAEARWLEGELAAAQVLAEQAAEAFSAADDQLGVGDACWIMASIAHDRGDPPACHDCLDRAGAAYRQAGDVARQTALSARQLWFLVFSDPLACRVALAEQFGRGGHPEPVTALWLDAVRAVVAEFVGDLGEAAGYFIRAYEGAMLTGQTGVAIQMATNAGDKFISLNDFAAALHWDECGLALARPTDWPISLGRGLMQTGNALHALGRLDEAHSILSEAIAVLSPFGSARTYAIALGYLGELALTLADYKAALNWFQQDEDCVVLLEQPDMLVGAWHGQARALAGLGRLAEAKSKAEAAWQLARDQANAEGQLMALRVLAALHRRPKPEQTNDQPADNACLYYLEQALQVAGAMSGHAKLALLYEELAAEYAQVGDYRRAYEFAVTASHTRLQQHSKEAQQRMLVGQIQLHGEASHAW
ncbi:hypothetical protein [Chitinimonas sp.]|uniref:hypothetical protein n=1 Tax=Chitinimonas sp. TaxID=1934313 RepID=UPI0035AF9A9D